MAVPARTVELSRLAAWLGASVNNATTSNSTDVVVAACSTDQTETDLAGNKGCVS